MVRLAEKAFYPAKIPFPAPQVDTGFDFPELLSTLDDSVGRLGVPLVVASVDEAITKGVVADDTYFAHRRGIRDRDGMLLSDCGSNPLKRGETAVERTRLRDVLAGDPPVGRGWALLSVGRLP